MLEWNNFFTNFSKSSDTINRVEDKNLCKDFIDIPEQFMCPICLGAFEEPCTLSCSHSFCISCVKGSRECPICRSSLSEELWLSKNDKLIDHGILSSMQNTKIKCHCGIELSISDANNHAAKCTYCKEDDIQQCNNKLIASLNKKSIRSNNQVQDNSVSSNTFNIPNSTGPTFVCPLCLMSTKVPNSSCMKYTIEALVNHCESMHKDDYQDDNNSESVTTMCPICVHIGDESAEVDCRNFISHLKSKHLLISTFLAAARASLSMGNAESRFQLLEDILFQYALNRSRYDNCMHPNNDNQHANSAAIEIIDIEDEEENADVFDEDIQEISQQHLNE